MGVGNGLLIGNYGEKLTVIANVSLSISTGLLEQHQLPIKQPNSTSFSH